MTWAYIISILFKLKGYLILLVHCNLLIFPFIFMSITVHNLCVAEKSSIMLGHHNHDATSCLTLCQLGIKHQLFRKNRIK